jgi:hypothetical protein
MQTVSQISYRDTTVRARMTTSLNNGPLTRATPKRLQCPACAASSAFPACHSPGRIVYGRKRLGRAYALPNWRHAVVPDQLKVPSRCSSSTSSTRLYGRPICVLRQPVSSAPFVVRRWRA